MHLNLMFHNCPVITFDIILISVKIIPLRAIIIMVTINEWNICNGLNAKYQDVGEDTKLAINILATRRQSNIIKTIKMLPDLDNSAAATF